MAISSSAGYDNLPTGNWLPAIYSQKVQKFFRTASVVEDITNTDYAGEIEAYGDTVNIIKEPTISVSSYTRGGTINIQNLADDQLQLVVDQANAFAFKVDDIEERQAHVNWEALATSSGAYALKDNYDENVIAAMVSGAGTTVGSDGSGTDTGFGTSETDPTDILANAAKRLHANAVPTDNRWFLGSPEFYEQLGQASAKLMDASVTGDGTSPLRNGSVLNGLVNGFRLYMTNNFAASSTSNYFKVLYGHMSSTATANAIAKTEVVRDPDSFADIVRGLHVFGRKVLRSEALQCRHLLID
jgi:hypothetical protein|tara:strand:+ start:1201 stop:2100 length:900 start_codon:yes stop_codon:yes gene_type:complete